MDPTNDRLPDEVTAFESVIVSAVLESEAQADPAITINARRATVENPEMLRHLRSL